MVTLVGTQKKFEEAIQELLELEYDASGAYKLAINKLRNNSYKVRLQEFLADHERHIARLHKFLHEVGVEAPTKGDIIKGMLAKMKVIVGDMTANDKNILRAMLDNEKDTNTAYGRIVNHPDKSLSIDTFLSQALEDERRHKDWLERMLS